VGGRKDFKATNEQFLGYFSGAGLKPQHAVLDIGCGIGIMASRLVRFLTTGSYDGFDIVKLGTDWATSHIGTNHPNFRFKHADIYNRHYNPGGKIMSEAYTFPYSDDTFDFAFAKSVFTHMLPVSVRRYLHEIARVLRADTRAVVTAFLINEESASLIRSGKSSLRLLQVAGNWVLDPKLAETAVGICESDFLSWCQKAEFEVSRIDYGSWCGRSAYLSYQDLVVLRRIK
jgi:ubiquinone/menaquinone biosynthesis C-methylase UbiE